MNPSESLSAVGGLIRTTAVPPDVTTRTPPTVLPVITISREAGIDDGAVAAILANLLNQDSKNHPWAVHDRDLIDRVAREHHLDPERVAAYDEHDEPLIESAFRGLSGGESGVSFAGKIAVTIHHLADEGHAIILGRGGQAILNHLPRALHVRLVAPEPWRMHCFTRHEQVNDSTALREIRKIDKDRRHYIRNHYGHDSADPLLYHLVLNMAKLSPARAADLIADLVIPDIAACD